MHLQETPAHKAGNSRWAAVQQSDSLERVSLDSLQRTTSITATDIVPRHTVYHVKLRYFIETLLLLISLKLHQAESINANTICSIILFVDPPDLCL